MSREPHRLPGIRFEPEGRPARDTLPAMDVAVFVGFAQQGPLHLPVAVEDASSFERVFGADVRLAWDDARSEWVTGNLGPAVRSFFANGGRRCWVIRVAGEGATCNTFPVPGLMLARFGRNGGVEVQSALARATSEGSWSDGIQVTTRLNRRALRIYGLYPAGEGCFRLELGGGEPVAVGDLLRVHLAERGTMLLAPVARVEPTLEGATRRGITVQTGRGLWLATEGSPQQPSAIPAEMGASPPWEEGMAGHRLTAEVLSFDLRARLRADAFAQASDLGFPLDHPRAWGALETDADFYQCIQAGPGGTGEPAGGRRRHPPDASRFPLAPQPIWDSPPEPGEVRHAFFCPWGMAEDFGEEPQPALPISGDALQRDGLSGFSAKSFLDDGLRDASLFTLIDRADFIRYRGPDPRPLRGIHAALGWRESPIADEATLLVVPDATHRPWYPAEEAASPPAPWWARVHPREQLASPPETPVPAPFADCVDRTLRAPDLCGLEGPDDNGTFRLGWSPVSGATGYHLQESTDGRFVAAVTVARTSELAMTLFGRAHGEYHFRVRAEAEDRVGHWSIPILVRLVPARPYRVDADPEYDWPVVLEVHRALLRLSAARGDLFAVLALPESFREADAMDYARRLRQAVTNVPTTLARGAVARQVYSEESGVLSYGALYHPWLITGATGRGFRRMPPDGAACGVLAQRARARGAWIAPANEPLRDVVALLHPAAPGRYADLQEARVNLVRQEPRGFFSLSAETLADNPDLTPIGVRRLLSLIRRLALRLGAEFVFEPHGEVLQRLVERRFERLLKELYGRGAFAGARPEDAFAVITDASVNPPPSMDLGRFVVELRVRPSLPLRFLTVRLIHSGGALQVTEAA